MTLTTQPLLTLSTMASFGTQLCFFFLLLLVLFPRTQAREGKFLSFSSHFRSTYDVKEYQVWLKKARAKAPAPAPESEPAFVDRGDGYGLYGSDSSQFSPTTTTFENDLLNEDLSGESYKTGYSKTNLYSNYNGISNPIINYDKQLYRNNFNNEEYRSNYDGNGYESKREGMRDVAGFVENRNYYYDVKNHNLNDQYESERGSYHEKNMYPNEFNNMEEYEKQQEEIQEYMP